MAARVRKGAAPPRVRHWVRPRAGAFILIVACTGCATSLRVTAAPTVDTRGRWGATLQLALGLGESYRHGRAALFATADLDGSADARPRTPAGAGGHVALGVGLDALGESPHFGFRIGALVRGRVPLPFDGRAGGAVGARLALLPVLAARHHAAAARCAAHASESWTLWHLGLAAEGAYLFGPDARGLFSVGPTFELDALLASDCPD